MDDEHKGEELKGRVKEGIGDVTGDKGLKREGQVDQGTAAAKRVVDDASEKVKEAVNPKR